MIVFIIPNLDAHHSRTNFMPMIGFTRGFSRDNISITVGEQITVEKLIEKQIIMRLSRHDHFI